MFMWGWERDDTRLGLYIAGLGSTLFTVGSFTPFSQETLPRGDVTRVTSQATGAEIRLNRRG